MKYSDIKNEIYGYYKHMGNIDIDNITDVNDHIIDEHLGNERFENNIEEFYILVSMCSYMVEHNLYDEYFFTSYEEVLEDFNNSNSLLNEIEESLKKDIDMISEYIKKDKIKNDYYNKLSSVYNDQIKD
jgi:hypothetical protein